MDLFPEEVWDARIAEFEGPLLEMNRLIDWESFRAPIEAVFVTEKRSPRGRRPFDRVQMFKSLVLRKLNGNLSHDQLEYFINDRRSWQRFLGIGWHDRIPDAKTLWEFEGRLAQAGVMETLLERFGQHLQREGYLARGGQLLDASLVKGPVRRDCRGEKEIIDPGAMPSDWTPAQRRQKDVDADWTKKHGKSHYGYKNHINVDRKYKLIRKQRVTVASRHDSQLIDDLLDGGNTGRTVHADSAYRSEETERKLKEKGFRSRIHEKGHRHRPLNGHQQRANRAKSKVRARVEHVFGAQSLARMNIIRSIGLVRARAAIALSNLCYNLQRFLFLKRAGVVPV